MEATFVYLPLWFVALRACSKWIFFPPPTTDGVEIGFQFCHAGRLVGHGLQRRVWFARRRDWVTVWSGYSDRLLQSLWIETPNSYCIRWEVALFTDWYLWQCLFAFPLLWNATIPFSKISVLLMYLMIIPVGRMFLAVRILGVLIVVWNIGSFFAGLFICWPIAYNWDQNISGGHCGSQPRYYFALGIINLVTDFVIIGLPMPFLYRLLLPRSKRLFAMGMFSVGFL